MSTTEYETICPICGTVIDAQQDNTTGDIHIRCSDCGYAGIKYDKK